MQTEHLVIVYYATVASLPKEVVQGKRLSLQSLFTQEKLKNEETLDFDKLEYD